MPSKLTFNDEIDMLVKGCTSIQLAEEIYHAGYRLLHSSVLKDAAMMASSESYKAFELFKKALRDWEVSRESK